MKKKHNLAGENLVVLKYTLYRPIIGACNVRVFAYYRFKGQYYIRLHNYYDCKGLLSGPYTCKYVLYKLSKINTCMQPIIQTVTKKKQKTIQSENRIFENFVRKKFNTIFSY